MQISDDIEDEPGNISRFLGLKNSYTIEKEYIKKVLKKAYNQKIIQPYQYNILKKTLELDDIVVSDIMTHRIDIKAINKNATIKDLIDVSSSGYFSKIPVYENDIDNIIGVVYIKDVLRAIVDKKTLNDKITNIIKDILFVPQSIKCIDLIDSFATNRTDMAVVIDEYGGTSGIVSLKDIFDVVLMYTEVCYDKNNTNIKKVDDSTIIFDGDVSLEFVCGELGIDIEKNENFDTLGGFLVNELGKVPQEENAIVEYQKIRFEVLSVNKQHIEKVKATKLQN